VVRRAPRRAPDAAGQGRGDGSPNSSLHATSWTWTAIDADTKLVFSVLVGGRDAGYAYEFLADVKARVDGRFQLTSDGHAAYRLAAREVFKDAEIDWAQLVKVYGAPTGEGSERRYSPGDVTGIKKRRRAGSPDIQTAPLPAT
jgi:hypothetical protein